MNKYEIIGIVGEGAYGVVYKAKNKETGEFGNFLLFLTPSLLLPFYSCNKEIQRIIRWRLNCKENNFKRS